MKTISLKKSNALLKGAAALAIGTFIAKFLGAFYRVPLSNLLGGRGLGIYQTVFPVYMILLDISGSALPSAISKITASFSGDSADNERKIFIKHCLMIIGTLGAAGTLIMILLSYPIATFQGAPEARIAYLTLSPSVFFVALISCFRGYFQGKEKMYPTSVSQIVEQTVKLAVGIFFMSVFLPDVALAVGGATLAVTISEVVGFVYLFIIYKKDVKNLPLYKNRNLKSDAKELVKYGIPATISGIAVPLSHLVDSFMIVNILSSYRTDATVLYGLLTGAVFSVINLPVAICYGISAATVPYIAKAKNELNDKTYFAVSVTFFTALIGAAAVFIFSPYIVKILFSGISAGEKSITALLLKGTAVNVILISLIQTQNAVLTGAGKPFLPVFSLAAGVFLKVILNFLLLPIKELNIYGGAISSIACYFTAVLINFIWLRVKVIKNAAKRDTGREYAT